MGCSLERQQSWLERSHNSERHVHTHAYVETLSQKKLVKGENVRKDRWLSREDSAAVRWGEGRARDKFYQWLKASHYTTLWLVYFHSSSGWSPRSQLPFSTYEFCRHAVTVSLGIWMSACPRLCDYFSFGNRSTRFAHGKKWMNSFAGAILMYS